MAEGKKITRSRNGCLTCKKRRRKCDEAKPFCLNCTSTGRECLGYGIKLVFDVDDKRNFSNVNFKQVNSNGNVKYGFVGRPKANLDKNEYVDNTNSSVKFTTVTGSNRKEEQDSSISFVKPSLSDTRGTNYAQEAITPDMPCPNSLGPLTTPTEIDTSKNDIKNLLNPAATSAYISSVMNKADSNLTVRSSSSTTENDELEILDDPEQFESAFLSGIDYILDNYDNQLLVGNTPNSEIYTPINFLQLDHIELPAPSPVVPTTPHIIEDLDSNNLGTQLKKKEENHILKHFFEKVIFLLDAHPQSPWPSLMMKFGSEELAKSCFLSLSSMHLYVNNGGDEFYKKGLLHINNTMEYLIKYVKTNSTSASSNEFDVPKIISKIKLESSSNSNFKKNKNFLVILLILYVHLLFAILESGRSALARLFLKLSASIASDPLFNKRLKKIKQSQSLLCVLSWFDTVSALISPDCRLPYCNPKWFGESTDLISTDNMNGCPVGIFKIMYDLSVYRNQLMNLFLKEEISMNDLKCCYKKLLDLREKCLHYRDHVILDLQNSTFSYIERLKCAQLWSLSTLLVTYKLEVFYFNNFKTVNFTSNLSVKTSNLTEASVPQFQLYSEQTTAIVCEFLDVYQTLPSDSPIITQMVWPIFNVACFSHSVENRKRSWECLQTLYETVKMGTIKSLMEITENVWNDGFSVERILSSEGWFASGIDMLPC